MTSIGRYELIAQLGGGPMGSVHSAKDPVLERNVALKILSASAASDSELVERFYREAKICAKLRHPNLVPVYDVGQEERVPYIVMELIDGLNLRQLIQNGSTIPLEEKLGIVEAISEGLAYSHSMGVIHRDIKPSNIVIDRDGRVRILDFGVALTAASSLTAAGMVLGTPQYMSPEQTQGKQCDERSDIFSLAVVAWELITGKHPFNGQPMGDRTGFPSNGSTGVPQEMLAVLRRAMSRTTEERYGSAREFANALRAASEPSPKARPLDETPIPQPKPRRIGGTETILSEVLVNLQKFEEAADNGDISAAQEAMIALRRAGGDDTRYAIALEQSAKRLDELERQNPTQGEKLSTPELRKEPPVAPPTPEPVTSPQYSSSFGSGGLDATSLFKSKSTASASSIHFAPPQPTPVSVEPLPLFHTQPSFTAPVPSTRRIPELQTTAVGRASRPARSHRWSTVIIVALVVICLSLGGVYLANSYWRQAPKPLPFVATAEVVNVEAPLYTEPNAERAAIAVAHHGDVVNILRVPRDPEQQWTEVQLISAGKATPAVFVHTADLGKWSSADPSLDETLRRMFLGSAPTMAR